jgi:hypothetical protein
MKTAGVKRVAFRPGLLTDCNPGNCQTVRRTTPIVISPPASLIKVVAG